MTEPWSSADSGILRKHKAPDVEELLVFGYSCKLFRDDEKALSIDQGKHLIPWMGDEKVKIDRYDGRGALADLQAHEAISHWDYNEGLSDEERRAEQLCDEERYRALYERSEEEEIYKEEVMKRAQQQDHVKVYGQVPFNYSDVGGGDDEPEDTSKSTDLDENEPYVPPTNLDIPINMKLPPNKKLAIILERTANFIAQQGGQMEILLKAKQQHNPQFEFLNHDNELFAFYRHVLMAIKTGRYKYTEAPEKPEKESTQHSEDEASYYLHPSLASNISKVDSAPALPSIPTLNYKPSADCAYSMLVNKIKGTSTTTETTPEAEKESNVNVELDKQPEKVESNDTNTNASSEDYVNQWNQYYNSEQYQEYYRHYYYATYGIDPLSLDYNNAIQKPPVMYLQSNPPMPPDNPPENTEKAAVPSVAEPVVENEPVKAPKPKLQIGALAHYYNTDSDNSDSEIEVENLVPIPPDAEKLIIVKMAIYVAKNGKEFEEIVKAKKDPRFNFLTPTHQYHTFYKTKLNAQLISMGKIINNGCENSSEDVEKKDDETPEEQQQQKPKIIAAPVSFTIKKPKEPEQIITKPALPLEDSDEDEEQTKNISKIESSSYVANNETNVVETIKECTNTAKVKQENNRESIETKISSIDDKKDEEKVNSPSSETNIVDDEMVISSDPELSNASTPELVKNETNGDLTEDQCIENQDKKFHSEMKAVENECIDLTNDSVKPNCDDEVTILRENGLIDESSGNNVKKLQLERKKRAMEFLNHLKSEDPKESVHRKSRKHSSDKKESSRRHKSSKRSRKRSDSASDESPPKMKKSKKKSRSHSRSSRTHKHRKHSKSNHHEDE